MNRHYILAIVNCLSLVVIFTTIFNPCIPCSLTLSAADKINGVIISILSGVPVSTLFYYLLVYLPERSKGNSIRSLIYAKLNIISTEALQIKACLEEANSINNNDPDFLDKIQNIKELQGGAFQFIYNLIDKNGNKYTFNWHSDSEIHYISCRSRILLRNLSQIMALPNIIFEDELLIKLLVEIEGSRFLKKVEILADYPPGVQVNDLGESIVEFYALYARLLKYTTPDTLEIKSFTWKI